MKKIKTTDILLPLFVFVFMFGFPPLVFASHTETLAAFPLLSTIYHIVSNETFTYFLAGVMCASAVYIVSLVRKPRLFLEALAEKNAAKLFPHTAIRGIDGTYHGSLNRFQKKLRYTKGAFFLSLLAMTLKMLILLGLTLFLLNLSDRTLAALSTQEPVFPETPQDRRGKEEAAFEEPLDFKLKKTGFVTAPSLLISVPSTEDHRKLEQALDENFRATGLLKNNRVEYTLADLMTGNIKVRPQDVLTLLGTSLPNSMVHISFNAPAQSETISRPVDALGVWRIAFTSCVIGSNAIYGTSNLGSIATEETFFGTFLCVHEMPLYEASYERVEQDLEQINLQVTAPTLATLALWNVAATLPLVGFFPYLMYLFSEPFNILFRRRREGWGVVYDSITKQPVDLAVVRLYDFHTKKLLQTRVTDRYGRYNFIVDPGRYFLTVQKANYLFPTTVLKNKIEDAKYAKLYHGEEIIIQHTGRTLMNYNIPIDIAFTQQDAKALLLDEVFHQGQRSLALLGPILALIAFSLTPNGLFLALLVLHIIFYLVFRRFTTTHRYKTYGTVKDAKTKKPLKGVMIKLLDQTYNRLLETKLSNHKGQYNFLVGENNYYVTVEKKGYKPFTSNTISISKGEDGIVSSDVLLSKV